MLFVGLTVFALVVSVGFWLAGAWLVFPFAGLELAVVGAVLYRLVRHRDDHERVTVDRDHVAIVRRRGGRERCDRFQRYWAKVSLERRWGWYPSRLLVGSHGRWVEIGANVNEEERELLAARLREILGRPAGNERAV